jgi:predicted metal-dependent peptidase
VGGLSLTAADHAAKRAARSAWEDDRVQLMLHQPFLALLAMQLELVPVVDARLDTAATDGEKIFVNAHFLLALPPAKRLFVLAHEVWHCAALHFMRRGERDMRLWNFACDHEVNALLQSLGLAVPEDAVLYPWHMGANAETVYDWLNDNPQQAGERPDWADQHEELEPAPGPRDPDLQLGSGQWEEWPTRVIAAAQQVEQGRGQLSEELERFIEHYRSPGVPWRALLARFVIAALQRQRRWTPPNRRYVAQGLYLPGWQREVELDLAVAINTSGSTQPYLEHFLAELVGIVQSFGIWRLRLLMCDLDVRNDRTYDSDNPVDPGRLAFIGGGGTDFLPVFERLESAPPKLLVYLTDGEGEAPEQAPPYPVIWALLPSGIRPAAWGESLCLPVL